MDKTISDMMESDRTRNYCKRILNDPRIGYDLIFLGDKADDLKPPASLPRKSPVHLRKLRRPLDHFSGLRPMAREIFGQKTNSNGCPVVAIHRVPEFPDQLA